MRHLTEAEAWEVVAQIFEWPEAPRHVRCGMCKTITTMWKRDLIDEGTLEQMQQRIRRRLDKMHKCVYFSKYRAGHDPLRVRIAREFAKVAA